MRYDDDPSDPRLNHLLGLVRDLSSAKTPQEVLQSFGRGMAEIMPPTAFISASCRGLPAGQYKITRMSPAGWMENLAEADPWRQWDDLAVREGGLLGELIARGRPSLVRDLAIQDDPVLGGLLAAYDAIVAVPLFDAGQPLNWAFHLRTDPPGFSSEELEEMLLRGNLVGNAVKHVKTAEQLAKANAMIREELERIANIQRSLLPQPIPEVPGLAIAASYKVFDAAGGDLYEVLPLRPRRGIDPECEQTASSSARASASVGQPQPAVRSGRVAVGQDLGDHGDTSEAMAAPELWGLLVGDVSGHGPSAAVVMAMLHSIIHAYPGPTHDPGRMLCYANEHLSAKRIEQSFATAFLAAFTPASRELVYACAGHNPPLLLSGEGPTRCLDRLDAVGSVPLGILSGVSYESARVRLEPGQTLLMYTDGVTEAFSPDEELFGEQRLIEALLNSDGSPQGVIQSVQSALVAHQAGARPMDDQTMLAIQVEG
jgi:sigma-B regulation protein RsbU (phosphoserine phosphatase)